MNIRKLLRLRWKFTDLRAAIANNLPLGHAAMRDEHNTSIAVRDQDGPYAYVDLAKDGRSALLVYSVDCAPNEAARLAMTIATLISVRIDTETMFAAQNLFDDANTEVH